MKLTKSIQPFIYRGDRPFVIADTPTLIEPYYKSKKHYRESLESFKEEINDLQNIMYAHNRYAMLLIFQAMDSAGKDGTIQHVMSGVNPHGVQVTAFKKPGPVALDHDYMWRCRRVFPERGKIGIFNRSYYEEVLVVKVHPGILHSQGLPDEEMQDLDQLWKNRYEDMCNIELYSHRNGIRVLKFFLHLSKDEQKRRFLDRINKPSKNWKFSDADIKERGYWDQYQEAYESCINATATPYAPWHVIPADDKPNMRIIVSAIILEHLRQLDMSYPTLPQEQLDALSTYKSMLLIEN